MIDRQKCLVMSALLAVQAASGTLALPKRDVVQAIKKGPKLHTLRHAIALVRQIEDDKVVIMEIDAAHDFNKRFRKMNDKLFIERFPHLQELWTDTVAPPIFTGGAQGQASVKPVKPPTQKELLAKLNSLRKRQSLKPIKQWKGSIAELEQRIAVLTKSIEKDSIKPWKQYPTAVAEGAYRSDMEAKHRTGLLMTKADEKREAAKQRHIAKRIAGDSIPETKEKWFKSAKLAGMIHLSDIAQAMGHDAKWARRKARLNQRDISKLEKAKYQFDPKDIDKVKAILERDGRKS